MERKVWVAAAAAGFFVLASAGVWMTTMRARPKPEGEIARGGDMADRMRAVEQLIRNDPTNPGHRARMAELFMRSGDWDNAREQLIRAVELDPRDASLRVRLAMVLWHGGDAAGGMKRLDEALELAPGLVEARFYRAVLLARDEAKRGEALGELERVIELAPGSGFAREARERIKGLRGAGKGSREGP